MTRLTGCAAAMTALLAALPARANAPGAEARQQKPPGESLRGELAAAPLLAAGLMPSLGSGISLAKSFRWPSFSVALDARIFTSLSDTPVERVRITASIALPTLHVCGHRAILAVCLVVDAGELRINTKSAKSNEARDPWGVSIGLRIGADWQFAERIGLRGFVELHAQSDRPGVWVNNKEAWQAPPVFGLVGLGLVVELGPT